MDMKICVLAGDGIGPEITEQAVRVLETVCTVKKISLTRTDALIGGAAIDAVGVPLPDETLAKCRAADAVLLGAVGGPKWDAQPASLRPEKGLLGVRAALGLYANLRPVSIFPALRGASPLRDEAIGPGVDIMVVRELTGDVYFGEHTRGEQNGVLFGRDVMSYNVPEVERIARTAFKLAGRRHGRVVSVDKANVLETSRVWRETVARVSREFPDIALEHMYVDNAAMQLVRNPSQFDVIVTGNLFGDILSDESSMISGSIGLLPSASLGDGKFGLYEPIHGSAPDIAGKGLANPLAAILSVAMLLRYTFGLSEEAAAVEQAVGQALETARTPDIQCGGLPVYTTAQMGGLVAENALKLLS
ncbi:3-isopropylmalate dehydrogenase [Anaerotruncus colihominis]|uniref:3-isopropylmalate dehydrogenase n=1 Tax=Anaerotruncus colihominis DSM 17241 TaxID=445972 RepID=B0P8D4_9FIRM|nr:3-isopropylmalate dehydrogenase [Anaerotruncus colihominis]EDS12180.1 3-isopropylmalate dehydrogenase [Anaerotruncus colihominis DSM 17241]UWN74319.1 3-isopropylmalate dehydrogenase [Anaerotruncus colihominis]